MKGSDIKGKHGILYLIDYFPTIKIVLVIGQLGVAEPDISLAATRKKVSCAMNKQGGFRSVWTFVQADKKSALFAQTV